MDMAFKSVHHCPQNILLTKTFNGCVSANSFRLDDSIVHNLIRVSYYSAYHLKAGTLMFFNAVTVPDLLDPPLPSLGISLSSYSW